MEKEGVQSLCCDVCQVVGMTNPIGKMRKLRHREVNSPAVDHILPVCTAGRHMKLNEEGPKKTLVHVKSF